MFLFSFFFGKKKLSPPSVTEMELKPTVFIFIFYENHLMWLI